MKHINKLFSICPLTLLVVTLLGGCSAKDKNVRVLRILNSEDYIYEYEEGDEEYATGDYDYQEDMIKQFEHYWFDKYDEKIKVVYDTFDTNETMFNELKTGKTTYDICIPSDYMVQKLYANDMLHKFVEKDAIWSTISPYIEDVYGNIESSLIGTEEKVKIADYSVPYMWGTMGIMYNPSYFEDNFGVTNEEIHELMKDWDSLYGEVLKGTFSIKDSVRDTFAVSLIHTYGEEISDISSFEELCDVFNRHDDETFQKVKEDMNNLKANAFGFETDSGKTDMTTQKIGANMCWSGDATWAITEAREDDLELFYSIPTSFNKEEDKGASNLWFDCFCMPKNAKDENNQSENEKAQYALAEEFIEFMCMPENAAQNCYCVGYTPAVAGDAMLDYMYDCYDVRGVVGKTEIEDEETGEVTLVEELIEGEDYELYDLSYFFKNSLEEYNESDCVLYADPDYVGRELTAQYPLEETLERCAIMNDFGEEGTVKLLDMWESVRTNALPTWAIVVFIVEGISALVLIGYFVYKTVIRKKLKNKRT